MIRGVNVKTSFLTTIAAATKIRVEQARALLSDDDLVNLAANKRIPLSFTEIFSNLKPNIIAEVKLASPALGKISTALPIEVAKEYLENGAAAISVLTEPQYFNGSLTYLESIRSAFPNAYLLMKDFIIDEYQLLQALVYGADAVLLIVALLEKPQLNKLFNFALKLGLTPLVEVHTKEELAVAESIGANLIGINSRNLQTLKVNLNNAQKIIQYAKSNAIFIAESGIKTADDIVVLQDLGYRGFLIGSSFMQTNSPGNALKTLRSGVINAG